MTIVWPQTTYFHQWNNNNKHKRTPSLPPLSLLVFSQFLLLFLFYVCMQFWHNHRKYLRNSFNSWKIMQTHTHTGRERQSYTHKQGQRQAAAKARPQEEIKRKQKKHHQLPYPFCASFRHFHPHRHTYTRTHPTVRQTARRSKRALGSPYVKTTTHT